MAGGGLGITWEDDPGSSDTGIVWEDDPEAKLGGPTGLASKRLAALGGKPESEKGDFAPQPPVTEKAISLSPAPRPAIAPAEEPDTPSAFLTPELQSFFQKNKQEALRKARENTFPSVGDMAGNVADWAGRQKAALDADLDREAAAQAAEDAAGEARHDKYIAPLERRVGDLLTGAGAAAREAIGGYGDISPDATPIQRARLRRRAPAPDLAGGGVRKYEPPKAGEPYLPLGAGVEQYRPVSEQAAARLAALRSGDDGTVRRENARPLFEGKALGEAPATSRLNPEDTLRATAPARYLENDYTKVHDWAQGAADDLGKWATEDTEHSALARLVDRGEKSDSLTANVLAAGAKGVTQAITSSAPALAEFAVLHRATPGAFKPLVDAAITSWFSGEGVGQVAEASPAVGTDIGSAIGGDPVPFNELAQHLGQLGMGAFMGATPLGAKSPIAKSIEGNRFLDPGLASGRSPEQARLYGEATRGQADREMASRAISVEEGVPMIGAFNRAPITAPLTDLVSGGYDALFNRNQSEVLPRPRIGRSPLAPLAALGDAPPTASGFTAPMDIFDLASGRTPTPYDPEMGPERWEGVVPRLAPFESPVGPPVPYSVRERLAHAQLLEGQGPPDLSRAERAMHSIPSGPEGQVRGPFPVPPDVLAQGRTPPADLQARTGNAPRPAAPVDPEAARVLASILSGGEEPPPAPTLPARPPLPTVGDVPSWQDRQRAERASPAKPPAEENIQVEPKATTDAQLEMVDEGQGQPGKKPGVLYTVQGGAKPPDVVPEGLARVDGPAGTLIFDPSKVTPEQAREALTSGEGLDKALGFSGPRPEPHPDNAVVSVLGKDGVEKSSQVAGPGDIEGAVKAAQGMAGEGDQVAVRTPDEVIADRQAGIEAEKKPPVERRVEDKGPEGRLHFVDPGQVVEEYRAKQRARVLDAMDKREEEVRNAGREQANADERAHIAERIAAEHALAGDQGARRGGLPAGDERDAGPSPAPARVEAPEPGPGHEAPPTPEPGVWPAAEPVVPGARKALLDERAASIEERRDLQEKVRRGDLSPKKLARAKEELRETELHLKALDKKLGYGPGGPTAAQVEADLKERFGDRYEPDVPEPVEAKAEAPKGKPARVWVSPTEPLDVEYKIVEADTVRTSHDKRTGEPTPGFPQRKQPRDRSRESYLRQQAEIGQRPNPDLLLEGPEASVGAPITSEPGPEGIRDAEHGNGRTNGIRIAYEDGNAGEYRQRLIDDASRYGMTPEAVEGMREPILIRERKTDLSAKEQVSIAKESNKGTAERMGTAEQAAVDAGAMTPELLSQFAPSESGDIMAASNRPFLRGFFSEIADSGDMVDRAGNVSAAGVARVKAAILAKAYGETSVLERALEAADDNTRNVSAGLLSAAPRVAKVRAMAESGELHPVDFTTPIKEAVDHLAHARDQGVSVADYLDQQDLFGDQISPEGRDVLSFLDKNKRSPKKIAGFIDSLARAVEAAGHPDQTDLFGGAPDAPSRAETFASAKRIYESRFESEGTQTGLFDQTGSGGPDRGAGPGAAPGGGGGAPGGGRPGGGEPGGKPRVFAYSSGKGVGRDPYAERTGKQAVPVPTFKRLPRTPPVRPPEGPLEVLKAESLVPAYARLKNGGQEMLDDIHEVFSATTVSDSAKRTADIKRKNYAQRDFRMARLDTALRPVRDYFDKLRPADRMKAAVDFIGTIERQDPKDPKNSPKQATPELEKHAALLRAILDASWREVEEYGYDGSANYLENYFPRIFEKPDAAARFAHEWYERRSAEGSKGFLHKRYYELLDDALATGLKLADDNPADIVKNHVAQVQQYLMWQKEKGQSIRERIWRYKPVDMPMPEGYDIVHPEKGVVYGDPSVAVGEAVTKRFRLMEDIAKDLNIPHERLAGVGGEFGRAEVSGSAGDGRVVTRFGTPVGVLAHEIGHVLDTRYKLWDALMASDGSPTIRRELRDLADLRYESKPTVSDSYKQYVRTAEEQTANMLDAYVSEPGLMRELAPVTLGEFRKFLLDKPELHKFFDMQPGLELEERVTRVPVKGKVIIGHWIAPRPVVKLIDRSLTPGLQNKLWYRTFRGITNAMNQVQLGMSGFHAVFTGLDAITSQVSLALEEAAHGEYGNAMKHTLTSPIAPLQMLAEGKRIRDMAKAVSVGASFESMPAEVQNLLRAGGAITQDVRYSTGQVDAMKRAWNRGNPVWAAGHLPGAFLETMAKPIMEHWVPAIKVGMFAREAEFILRRLGPDATGAEISHHLGRIWDSVENRMGQLRYDNLMWDRIMKDLGQVAVRSLGWNLGDIREIGGGIFDAGRTGARSVKNAEVEAKKTAARGEIRKAEGALAQAQQGGKPAEIEKAEAALRRAQAAMPSNLNDPVFTRRMAYSLAMPITVGTMGAIYYYGKHGKLPANIKDAFAIPTGGRNKDGSEERVFLPTYAKDVYAWAKDPFTTATHKLSPGVSIGAEIAKNQDYWGSQVREGNAAEQTRDSVEHAIRQMVPMSFRQILQSKFPGSNIGSGEALMGVTKAPASLSRSDAEEALNEYLRRTSGGVKTKEEAAKSKARSEIKALIRGGHDEAADAAIEKAIAEGQVSADDAHGRKALYKAAAKTVLENTLRSMPVDEALEVYRAATPEERQRWADAFRGRIFGSASRRPAWWKDKSEEQVEAIKAEAEKLLPPE